MLVAAELIKLTRQRGALFWGFVALPLMLTAITCALVSIGSPGGGVAEVRMVRSLLRALSVAGNPFAQLFYAVGAAAIFAVEYRHAGWRHLVPRRSRSALLGAKFAAFLIAGGLSLALVAAGDLLANLAVPWLRGSAPVAADWAGGAPGAILLSALLALANLASLGVLVALIATVTRSPMGAILAPFLFAFGCAIAQIYFGDPSIPLPAFASDALRQTIAAPFDERARAADGVAIPLAVLIGWILIPAAATLALFERQDLTSE